MKLICAIALVCLAGVAARAAPVDMSTQTCRDWLEADDDVQDQMVAWLRGYLAGRSTSTAYDFASLRGDRTMLRGYCQAHPTSGLVSAASEWRH